MSDDQIETQAAGENVDSAADPPPGAPTEASPLVRPRRRRGRPSRARGKPHSSDDAAGRWTIRGVPPQVREIALREAGQRGMTVGDWVAEAIVGFARGNGRATVDDGPKLPVVERPPDLIALVERLDARLTRLEERPPVGIFGRIFGRHA